MKNFICLGVLILNVYLVASTIPPWRQVDQPVKCKDTTQPNLSNSFDVSGGTQVALDSNLVFIKSSVQIFSSVEGSTTGRQTFVYKYYFETILGQKYIKITQTNNNGLVLKNQHYAVLQNSVLIDESRGVAVVQETDASSVVVINFYQIRAGSPPDLAKYLTLSASQNSAVFSQTFNKIQADNNNQYFYFETKCSSLNYYLYKFVVLGSTLSLKATVASIPATSQVWSNEAGFLQITSIYTTNFYAINSDSTTTVTKIQMNTWSDTIDPALMKTYVLTMQQSLYVLINSGQATGANTTSIQIKYDGLSQYAGFTVPYFSNAELTVYTDYKTTIVLIDKTSDSIMYYFYESYSTPQKFYSPQFPSTTPHFTEIISDFASSLHITFGFYGVEESSSPLTYQTAHYTYLMKACSIAKYGIYPTASVDANYDYQIIKIFDVSLSSSIDTLLADPSANSYQFLATIVCKCSAVLITNFVCFAGSAACTIVAKNMDVTC